MEERQTLQGTTRVDTLYVKCIEERMIKSYYKGGHTSLYILYCMWLTQTLSRVCAALCPIHVHTFHCVCLTCMQDRQDGRERKTEVGRQRQQDDQ